ncbi:MAG TPA: type II toxin-antitoxin system PemK/MazF family toxin [Candidatus Paceibacterota bacterium]|nr:type II toxin-antitoxin system PemK/MazF family toxin [Candidatus Paceibacterota bacterium]
MNVKNYILALLGWCRVKFSIQYAKSDIFQFHEREIWWCHIGVNVGTEILGKNERFERPVLVYKKLAKESFLGIPLTTQLKTGSWYVPIDVKGISIRVVLSQIRIFDSKRLINKIDQIGAEKFSEIKKGFANLYL